MLVSSAPALAGTMTLRLFDPRSVPVSDAVVDLRDPATGEIVSPVPDVPDLDGRLVATVPDGVYEIRLKPDTGTELAGRVLPAQSTAGSFDLGDLVLEDGKSILAVIVDPLGAPVAGADIDLFDDVTKEKVFTPSDTTDALGAFEIVAVPGVYDLLVIPPAGSGLARRRKNDIVLNADIDCGIFALRNAIVASGRVIRTNGAPLANVDIYAADAFTSERYPLTDDDTVADGTFSVVVPDGNLRIEFSPRQSDRVAGRIVVVLGQVGDLAMGNVTLDPGSRLSGSIRRSNGSGITDADIDLYDGMGFLTPTFSDDSSPTGVYSVVGPQTLLDVFVTPPGSVPVQHALVSGVDLSSDRILTVTLPNAVATVDLDAIDIGLLPGDRFDYALSIRNRSGAAMTVVYSVVATVPGRPVSKTLLSPTSVLLPATSDPVPLGPFGRRVPPTLKPRLRNIPVRVTAYVADPGTSATLDFDLAHFTVY
jgi:hypothetical protein